MNFITHLLRERLLLHVFEGDEAVAGLPLLVRKLAVCHGEELFVQVGRLFDLVQLVVRRRRKEQTTRRTVASTVARNANACKVTVGSLLAEAAKARWLAALPRSSLEGKAAGSATARLRRASASA